MAPWIRVVVSPSHGVGGGVPPSLVLVYVEGAPSTRHLHERCFPALCDASSGPALSGSVAVTLGMDTCSSGRDPHSPGDACVRVRRVACASRVRVYAYACAGTLPR